MASSKFPSLAEYNKVNNNGVILKIIKQVTFRAYNIRERDLVRHNSGGTHFVQNAFGLVNNH